MSSIQNLIEEKLCKVKVNNTKSGTYGNTNIDTKPKD